jgi:hypothetical protein
VFESYFGERLFAEKVPELVLIDAPSDPQSLGFQPFVDFSTQLRGDS